MCGGVCYEVGFQARKGDIDNGFVVYVSLRRHMVNISKSIMARNKRRLIDARLQLRCAMRHFRRSGFPFLERIPFERQQNSIHVAS